MSGVREGIYPFDEDILACSAYGPGQENDLSLLWQAGISQEDPDKIKGQKGKPSKEHSKMHFGFSYVGLIYLVMLFAPNIKWARNKRRLRDMEHVCSFCHILFSCDGKEVS